MTAGFKTVEPLEYYRRILKRTAIPVEEIFMNSEPHCQPKFN